MNLYAVKIIHTSGSEGYHSLWKSKQKAEACRDRYQCMGNYKVEKVEPIEVSKSGQCRFADSVGFMFICDEEDSNETKV